MARIKLYKPREATRRTLARIREANLSINEFGWVRFAICRRMDYYADALFSDFEIDGEEVNWHRTQLKELAWLQERVSLLCQEKFMGGRPTLPNKHLLRVQAMNSGFEKIYGKKGPFKRPTKPAVLKKRRFKKPLKDHYRD